MAAGAALVSSELPSYTLIHVPSDFEVPSEQQLRTDLEKGDTKVKIAALKKTIQLILNGEKLPNLLMVIIRFVLPSQVVRRKGGIVGIFEGIWRSQCNNDLALDYILSFIGGQFSWVISHCLFFLR